MRPASAQRRRGRRRLTQAQRDNREFAKRLAADVAALLRSGGVACDAVLRTRFPAVDEAYAAAVDAIQRRRLSSGKFTYRGMVLAVEITTLGRICVLDGRSRAPIIAGSL